MAGFLRTEGTKIVKPNGTPIVLRGAASGGHLNMENFINGYPGHETETKQAMLAVLGKEKSDFFWDKFYEYFWTDSDAKFFASLKLNCLRVSFNYRHFLDDGDLTKIKTEGFKLLDRAVESCARHGIYTILDLHSAPGGQNQNWHCDTGIHRALFWEFGHFQDCVVDLWRAIAAHYKDNTWIAGYNPLNEPGDPEHQRAVGFYNRVERAIRDVDPNHILFWDGNTYAADFRQFPKTAWPNSVYAIHDYSKFGFPASTEVYTSTADQKERLQQQYQRKLEYMIELNVPVWNGEWGPVYASNDDPNVESINNSRYQVLKDQLAIYNQGDPSGDKAPISWSIWLWKDLGYQAMTYLSPDTKWCRHLKPWLDKKRSLSLDRWGRDFAIPYEKDVYEPIKEHFRQVVPQRFQKMYPPTWEVGDWVDRLLRDTLLAQFLTAEFASYFEGMSFEELDEMAASFKFENCVVRETLVNELKASIED
jgi:aryl-phospho-beta-D-glucosidase BglC (GH1 family)